MKPLDESILCRASVQLAPTATGEMMFMPGGLQKITPFEGAEKDGDAAIPITVMVDQSGVAALNQQYAAILARDKKPYFDFNHRDHAASFWPEQFLWKESGPDGQAAPGIYCRGQWSASGKASVDGKEWRQFSPVFHVDKKRGATAEKPARIVARSWAHPNMGGLVNSAAFHAILPLWAKDASRPPEHSSGTQPGKPNQPNRTNTTTDMDEKELAALQAKNKELEKELGDLKSEQTALKAKNESDALVASRIAAKEHELRAGTAEALNAQLKKDLEAIKAGDLKRRGTEAKAFVAEMVKRGAIGAKEDKAIAEIEKNMTESPETFAPIYARWAGNPALGERITRSGAASARVTQESPNAVMSEWAALVCRNSLLKPQGKGANALLEAMALYEQKGELARKAAAIFAKDIEKDPTVSNMSMADILAGARDAIVAAFGEMKRDGAVVAADYSDPAGALGVLSGTLVLQRCLPDLMFEFPVISKITQDFSDAPGLFNQTELTRIVTTPAVETYDTTNGSDGRPNGWDTVAAAQTVDVPVTLNNHLGVPIVFGQDQLGTTTRNLFAEQAPKAMYALGKYIIQTLLCGLFTAANYNAYKANAATGGSTTTGSNVITVASTAMMFPGQEISGTGIPANTYVASITNSTTAVLTQNATATDNSADLTFTLNTDPQGNSFVPTNYATYVQALNAFTMQDLGAISSAFDAREIPFTDRILLLNSQYYGQLAKDPTLAASLYAAITNPGIITDRQLPKLQSILPMNAPWFPRGSNRVGIALAKAGAVLKQRLPIDFSSALGVMIPGSVTTVTIPGGISAMLVQYVDLKRGYAEWRIEDYIGVAPGDRRCGLVLTSQ